MKIQLLTSPQLQRQDVETLEKCVDARGREQLLQEVADRVVTDALDFASNPDDLDRRLLLFSWLVAAGHLEMRFAFADHVSDAGMYHEKIGIFSFPGGERVAFTGSANETENGHVLNYESIDVFRSWLVADEERVREKEEEFEALWEGEAPGIRTWRLSERVMRELHRVARDYIPENVPRGPSDHPTRQPVPNRSALWPHQGAAVERFLDAKHGVLEMATGTGKTRAALHICGELYSASAVQTIVVAADGTDLLDQWYDQLCLFAVQQRPSLAVYRSYGDHRQGQDFLVRPSQAILLTSRLNLPRVLRHMPDHIAGRTLLIHDEVHRLGSPANRANLSGLASNIQYRLGLSATPEREYDDAGTQFILAEVGPVIYRFTLADAIKRGILTEFDYVPLRYALTAEERRQVTALVRRLNSPAVDERLSREDLMIAIARVYKTAEQKLPAFEEYLRGNPEILRRCLIFVETVEYGTRTLDIVHRYRHDFHSYFAEENAEVLAKFAQGSLESLITCHRLSEGIDIRSIANVVLFSSARSKLETIQRMGRCLRTDPTMPAKCARVVDFVREPTGGQEGDNADEERRKWLTELATIRRDRS